MLEEVIIYHSNTFLPFNLPVQSMQQLWAAGQGGGEPTEGFYIITYHWRKKKKKKGYKPPDPGLHAWQKAANTNITAALAAEMLPEKMSSIQRYY